MSVVRRRNLIREEMPTGISYKISPHPYTQPRPVRRNDIVFYNFSYKIGFKNIIRCVHTVAPRERDLKRKSPPLGYRVPTSHSQTL